VVVLAVCAGLVLAIFAYQRSRKPVGPTYLTTKVDRGRISARVTATGALSAIVTVLVGSQVSGRIESIRVDFNSPVKKGQVIATIDPQLFQAAVAQNRANYDSARADVEKAQAQLVSADRQYTRAKNLFAQNLMSQADLDTAQANEGVARASLAAAQAGVEQAAASLHQSELNLKYTTIMSPIDGVVISRAVDVGQTVAASLQAPTLFTIAQDLTKMQVDTSVAEGDVGKIQEGMKVTFAVDAYPGKRFDGAVRQVRDNAQTVQNVVTYDAVIDVDNGQRLLKPGMTANVTFTPAEKNDVLRVPNAALRFKPDTAGLPLSSASWPVASSSAQPAGAPPAAGPGGRLPRTDRRTVWILRDSAPVAVPVQIGLTDGSLTEIVSGDLQDGDLAITEAIPPPGAPATGAAGGGSRRSSP
jgi:HlyD family secretion protein